MAATNHLPPLRHLHLQRTSGAISVSHHGSLFSDHHRASTMAATNHHPPSCHLHLQRTSGAISVNLQQIRRTSPRLREACSAHHHGHRRPAITSAHRPDQSSGHHFTSQTHLDQICASNFTIFIHACTCKTSAATAMAAIAPPPSSLAGEGGVAPSLHLCSQGRKEEGAANPNSGERLLCATCQHLIGQSNWSTGQLWSTGQS